MMSIKVDQTDLKHILSAIDNVIAAVTLQAEEIVREASETFANNLIKNITTQKYGDFGQPRKGTLYNRGTKFSTWQTRSSWKKGQPHEEDYWQWLGTTLKSISHWKLRADANKIQYWTGTKFGISTVGVRSGRTVAPVKTVTVLSSGKKIVRVTEAPKQARAKMEIELDRKKVMKASNTRIFSEMSPTEKASYLAERERQIAASKSTYVRSAIIDRNNDYEPMRSKGEQKN